MANKSYQFCGKVGSGVGKHSNLVIPGRLTLSNPPEEWPVAFYPGSLNIKVNRDGYPEGFQDPEAGGLGIAELDTGKIKPIVVLRWDKIENNGLKPIPQKPNRGNGQFWTAKITICHTNQSLNCWVFRRINSTIKKQLEIISEQQLRPTLSLIDGTEVTVDIFENIWNINHNKILRFKPGNYKEALTKCSS